MSYFQRNWMIASSILMTVFISSCENTIVAEYDTVRLKQLELKQEDGPSIVLRAGTGYDGEPVLLVSDQDGNILQQLGAPAKTNHHK